MFVKCVCQWLSQVLVWCCIERHWLHPLVNTPALRHEIQLKLYDSFNLLEIGSGQATSTVTEAQFANNCQLICHSLLRFAVERDNRLTWIETIDVGRKRDNLNAVQMFI